MLETSNFVHRLAMWSLMWWVSVFGSLSTNPVALCITAPAYLLSRDMHLIQLLCENILKAVDYDTRCYFNVCSKADMSRLNLPHWLLVRLRQPGKRSYKMTENNSGVCCSCDAWLIRRTKEYAYTQPGGVKLTHDCLAFCQRPSALITRIRLQITLRQIRAKAKSFLNTISSSPSTCTYIW